ncbi:MAG TPA: DUF3300 domain-containing protein [Deltaproteobacteria bacterium]|nr:DUF3300 domain-containing protein [Deltaproteobacteria bacterium]
MKRVTVCRLAMVFFLCMNLTVASGLMAQETKQGAEEKSSFRPEEIDQMVAPIALYPDDLLAQVFVASTYPLEIVQAARFVQQNKDLKGEKLMQAAKDKDWEPSVKAMLSFPDVLLMMNEKLEWTEKLGNAFLSQQKEVMTSVQRLRQKAQESGNLKTTKEQKVIVEKETKVIVIESASPQVVYVPTYNPTVVYGIWAYPAYPPYPVYPPGYVATTAAFSFAAGVAVGAAASGYGGWGCGWHGGSVNVNVNQYNSFTKNTYANANKYQVNPNNKNQNWQHNPEHRKGAQYPNQATAQKYGQQRSGSGGRATTSDARGYGGGAGGAGGGKPQTSDLSRGGGDKGGGKPQTSDLSRGGGKENALSGSGKGGSERASSFRGQESRSSASRSGGASSSSGGASRGGGGGRSGGGRR